ncbi:SAM-dependent methyltransferase [Pontibacillus halophilus JSM 076056 = DSM 19796]|uniref:tRNA 5-hydroxyuridine methyltransferase n=1 Tax=Pontibacillus halophilus JSM 076056 = DSM 19796 TaxID=1385510 RepID=A0A0A5GQP6_9BACI|nr:O-methyltransferase [Pontibacillus halophilus]KGX93538.1 SAM-dependent methyltransferase [Pontibacillus halophilus JSM 076056 = DSM 19796]
MIESTIEAYLLQNLPEQDADIKEMEAYAKEHHVPIMEPLGMEYLLQLLRIHQPDRILEIGAAIGYSAIRMAKELPNSHIVTIERDEERYQEAIDRIQKSGLSDRIDVVFGDALEKQDELLQSGPFDLLFIDAAKGQYQRFFEIYRTGLSKNGIIVSDNVLFKGYVAEEELGTSRKEKIAKKIKAYNEWLLQHPDYRTSIMPIGDGVAVSTPRE